MKFSFPLTLAAAGAFTSTLMTSLPAVSAVDLWKDLAGYTKSSTTSTTANLRRRMSNVPISPKCNPDDAFMIFNGHNQATSTTTGNIKISWSPPFVATYDDSSDEINGDGSEFIYCGGFTYYIFTSKGEDEDVFLERVNNKTIPELVEMANASPDDDFFLDVTTDLSFEWRKFKPGIDYTILVTAAANEGVLTAQGIESMNREPARLVVSSVVPKLRTTDVNGRKLAQGESPVIEIPTHPTDTFTTAVLVPPGDVDSDVVQDDIEPYYVIFYDDSPLPEAIEQIEQGLYFYAEGVSKIGTADLVKCVAELDVPFGLPTDIDAPDVTGKHAKACAVVKGDLGDIFEELDASADFFDDTNEIVENMELSDEEDQEAEDFVEGLDQEALLNLCIASNPDLENKEEECLADITSQFEEEVLAGNGGRKLRRLRCCRRFRKRMKKIGRTIKSTAKKVVKAVKEAVDVKIALKDTTLTLIDIDQGGRLTCESEKSGSSEGGVDFEGSVTSEIGVNLDFSAHMRFGITVRLVSGVEKAHASLFGGFGAKSYLMFQSTHKITFQPDPKLIFEKSSHKVFFVGPVPVIVTIRPSLSAFAEAAMVIESDILLEGQFGYDWEFGFSYHKDSGTKQISKFEERNDAKRAPVFDLRLSAAAEMGLTFAIDVVLYGVLQGTLAADTGFGAELEVSANVAALFDENQQDLYNLQKAELEAFIRIRGFVGLNTKIGKVIRDVTEDLNSKGSNSNKCDWKFAKYRVPELPSRDERDVIAEAREAVRGLSLEEIDVNGLLDSLGDTYSPDRGALEGQNLDFGANFEIFSVDFMLLDLVRDDAVSCASLTCDGGDECTISTCVDGLGCISETRDCGHDSTCVVGQGCVTNHVLSLCAEGTLRGDHCCGKCDGKCGGFDCGLRPGGPNECCMGGITRNGKICQSPFDTGCLLPTASCAQGTLSGEHCCGKCDGKCGGFDCGLRPGGPNECCMGAITRNGKICQSPFDTGCLLPQ